MATIKDVARLAKVSTTTVSHVINSTRYVSEPLRKRVMEAVEYLEYRPDRVASSLRSKTTHTIGVVISDISNPFYPSIIRGVEDAANTAGYNMILCNSDEDPRKEYLYLQVLHGKRVDGVIITPSLPTPENLRHFVRDGIPVVLLDREVDGLTADCVLVDNFKGAYQATSFLIEKGHKDIALVTGPLTLTTGKERYKGYVEALKIHGITIDNGLIIESDFKFEDAYTKVKGLFTSGRRPTSIFVANNQMALGAFTALREMGLRIPEDVSFICFDDIPWGQFIFPPLTVVAQPTYDLGNVAAKLLISRLRSKRKKRYRKVVLEPVFVVRGSA